MFASWRLARNERQRGMEMGRQPKTPQKKERLSAEMARHLQLSRLGEHGWWDLHGFALIVS